MRSDFVGDRSRNAASFIAKIREFGASDNFVRGFLFLCGATLSFAQDEAGYRVNASRIQKLYPFDPDADLSYLTEKFHDGRMKSILEEFIFKSGMLITFRPIVIQEHTFHLMEPKDRGLLKELNLPIKSLGEFHKLFTSLSEILGETLEKSEFNAEESFLLGIWYFNTLLRVDVTAASELKTQISHFAPPIFKFFFSYLKTEFDGFLEYTLIQIAYSGLVSGQDEKLIQIAWPHQSWIFFRNGTQREGVDSLSPPEFFDHCMHISEEFLAKHRADLAAVSHLAIGMGENPKLSAIRSSFHILSKYIGDKWGIYPSESRMDGMERRQFNACIIFVILCSISKEAALHS